MKRKLVEAHREYLISLIGSFLDTFDNKSITFYNGGCSINDTHVTKLYMDKDVIYIRTYDFDDINNQVDEILDDKELFDDLFLTELIYRIDNDEFETYTWRRIYNNVMQDNNEIFNEKINAYNSMRMAAFVEIENLTCEHKQFDVKFLQDEIIIKLNNNTKIEYYVIDNF